MMISYTSPATVTSSAADLMSSDISLGYAVDRRAADRERAALARTLAGGHRRTPLRERLGTRLIRIGRGIAGPAPADATPAPRLGTL